MTEGIPEKNEAAAALGRLGGLARMRWTPERRSEAARKAIQARWTKWKQEQGKLDTK